MKCLQFIKIHYNGQHSGVNSDLFGGFLYFCRPFTGNSMVAVACFSWNSFKIKNFCYEAYISAA